VAKQGVYFDIGMIIDKLPSLFKHTRNSVIVAKSLFGI